MSNENETVEVLVAELWNDGFNIRDRNRPKPFYKSVDDAAARIRAAVDRERRAIDPTSTAHWQQVADLLDIVITANEDSSVEIWPVRVSLHFDSDGGVWLSDSYKQDWICIPGQWLEGTPEHRIVRPRK